MKQYPCFEVFARDFITHETIHEHTILRPQYLFVYDHRGHCTMDFVGRFERFSTDCERVMSRLNIMSAAPHLNQSFRRDYREYYDKALARKVEHLYRKDVALFGYEFGQ